MAIHVELGCFLRGFCFKVPASHYYPPKVELKTIIIFFGKLNRQETVFFWNPQLLGFAAWFLGDPPDEVLTGGCSCEFGEDYISWYLSIQYVWHQSVLRSSLEIKHHSFGCESHSFYQHRGLSLIVFLTTTSIWHIVVFLEYIMRKSWQGSKNWMKRMKYLGSVETWKILHLKKQMAWLFMFVRVIVAVKEVQGRCWASKPEWKGFPDFCKYVNGQIKWIWIPKSSVRESQQGHLAN